MSAGINEIENRGGRGCGQRDAWLRRGRRQRPPTAEGSSARAKALRWDANIQNSQNEPGMSAGINEMENRGRESRLAREARVAGRPKDGCRGAPGTGGRVRRN